MFLITHHYDKLFFGRFIYFFRKNTIHDLVDSGYMSLTNEYLPSCIKTYAYVVSFWIYLCWELFMFINRNKFICFKNLQLRFKLLTCYVSFGDMQNDIWEHNTLSDLIEVGSKTLLKRFLFDCAESENTWQHPLAVWIEIPMLKVRIILYFLDTRSTIWNSTYIFLWVSLQKRLSLCVATNYLFNVIISSFLLDLYCIRNVFSYSLLLFLLKLWICR